MGPPLQLYSFLGIWLKTASRYLAAQSTGLKIKLNQSVFAPSRLFVRTTY